MAAFGILIYCVVVFLFFLVKRRQCLVYISRHRMFRGRLLKIKFSRVKNNDKKVDFLGIHYSQTRIKCSRPISSLPGLQGYKIFADAIIKILISTKSISDKNCYDELFINKVVQIFTFQFGESVTKFYVVKDIWILMKFFEDVVKYHKIFLRGTRKKFTSINFSGGRKNWKMAIFALHYIKVSSFFMPMQWTCKLQI